jgi:hypothetical protein
MISKKTFKSTVMVYTVIYKNQSDFQVVFERNLTDDKLFNLKKFTSNEIKFVIFIKTLSIKFNNFSDVTDENISAKYKYDPKKISNFEIYCINKISKKFLNQNPSVFDIHKYYRKLLVYKNGKMPKKLFKIKGLKDIKMITQS